MCGPEYIAFVGINILKTLQHLAATTRFFWRMNVPKISQTPNLRENLEINLLRNTFLVKLLTPSLQQCQKMNPIAGIFQVICLHLRSPCFKVNVKRKSNNFEIEWILC